jgi:ketosteroid isomerase-like protein
MAGAARGWVAGVRRWPAGAARRWLAAALAPLLAAGCVQTSASDAEAFREAELTMRSLMSAFETADAALVQDLFWPQATYDDFPNQHTYRGIDEIVGYVAAVHDWADDVYMNVGDIHVSADGAVAEWVFSGVQNRPLGNQVPVGTGREVVLNGVTIIEIQDGRILRAADYTDTGALMLQLGGRMELPGGSVIELEDMR